MISDLLWHWERLKIRLYFHDAIYAKHSTAEQSKKIGIDRHNTFANGIALPWCLQNNNKQYTNDYVDTMSSAPASKNRKAISLLHQYYTTENDQPQTQP